MTNRLPIRHRFVRLVWRFVAREERSYWPPRQVFHGSAIKELPSSHERLGSVCIMFPVHSWLIEALLRTNPLQVSLGPNIGQPYPQNRNEYQSLDEGEPANSLKDDRPRKQESNFNIK